MRLALARVQRLRRRLATLLTLAVGAAVGIWLWQQRPASAPNPVPAVARQPADECPAELADAQRKRRRLTEEVAYLKQSVIVEQEACFGVREALNDKQDQISDLREQVAFYRGIVSPEESTLGVRVHDLVLRPVQGRIFNFRLTLLQSVREGGEARGRVGLRLEALEGEKLRRLALESLMVTTEYSEEYLFRYYTEMFGEFELPDGLRPLRIVVSLTPRGKRKPAMVRTFVWDEMLAAPAAEE